MIEVRAASAQQHISLELPVAVESIVVDQQRILQILINYLSNAVKFTPAGGSIVLSSRLASESELAANTIPEETTDSPSYPPPDARFLVLEVSDTGIGIPPEKQHLLFRSFQQVDVTSDRPYEGSGLGLALSKQLAELHGGRVSFTSTVGSGSTFSVWLPL